MRNACCTGFCKSIRFYPMLFFEQLIFWGQPVCYKWEGPPEESIVCSAGRSLPGGKDGELLTMFVENLFINLFRGNCQDLDLVLTFCMPEKEDNSLRITGWEKSICNTYGKQYHPLIYLFKLSNCCWQINNLKKNVLTDLWNSTIPYLICISYLRKTNTLWAALLQIFYKYMYAKSGWSGGHVDDNYMEPKGFSASWTWYLHGILLKVCFLTVFFFFPYSPVIMFGLFEYLCFFL